MLTLTCIGVGATSHVINHLYEQSSLPGLSPPNSANLFDHVIFDLNS